jgi:HEAT repeat protein
MKRALAVVALLAAGVVVFAVTRGGEDSLAEPESAARKPSSHDGLGLRLRARAPGIEHRYAVSMDHTSKPSGGQPFALAVDGEWSLGVVATGDPVITTIRAELHDPMIRLRDVRSAAPKLSVPFTFTVAGDGRLLALQFPKSLDPDSRRVLTALAASAQIADGGTAAAWTAIETDSLGAYEARYTRDGDAIAKTKVMYRTSASDEPIAVRVSQSSTTIAMRTDGWADSIVQREQVEVGFDKASVTVAGTTTLRHLGERRVVAIAPLGLETVPIDAVSTAARDQDDRELLDGATLQDLIFVMGSVRDDGNASAHTYLRMVALFKLDPDAARKAGDQLLGGTLDPRDAQAVIGALGEAGTPVAQQALSKVVDATSVAEAQRVAGALSLGLTDTPLPSTMETLQAAARSTDAELSATATLALGNAALRLANSDAAAAARQVDELLARLEQASEITDRITLLRALGNTGDPRILPALELALASPSDMVRAAAAESLRLLPDARADALIIAVLDDASPIVRTSAVFAAAHRRLDPTAQALAIRARTDTDSAVRRAIVELAGQRMNELPSLLRPIVVNAAERDADADVRELAKKFLA